MKNIKYFTLLLVVVALASCTKHKILFETEPVSPTTAEYQLFNDLAIRSGEAAANTTLNCVVVGTDTVATTTYPLNARNVVPSGSTTRFWTCKPGTYAIKGWKKMDDARNGVNPDYEGSVTLVAGKQMVHIYNWFKDPICIDSDYPYIRTDRPNSTEYIYFNFINLWQEGSVSDYAAMNPTTHRIRYEMRLNKLKTDEYGPAGKTAWQPIGEPVGFGEATGFCPVVVPRKGKGYTGGPAENAIHYGQVTVYTRISIDETDEVLYTDDYWSNIRVGRFLTHTMYAKDRPANGVYVFQFYSL